MMHRLDLNPTAHRAAPALQPYRPVRTPVSVRSIVIGVPLALAVMLLPFVIGGVW